MPTPYELRFQVLSMAKDILMEEYHSKKDMIMQDWNNRVSFAMDAKLTLPDTPVLPDYPTESDILAKAELLNKFINNTK